MVMPRQPDAMRVVYTSSPALRKGELLSPVLCSRCAALCCAVLVVLRCLCCAVLWLWLWLWLCCGCAVLCCAVLCCAVLCCAVPCCAVLCCAVLCCAVLCGSCAVAVQ